MRGVNKVLLVRTLGVTDSFEVILKFKSPSSELSTGKKMGGLSTMHWYML